MRNRLSQLVVFAENVKQETLDSHPDKIPVELCLASGYVARRTNRPDTKHREDHLEQTRLTHLRLLSGSGMWKGGSVPRLSGKRVT